MNIILAMWEVDGIVDGLLPALMCILIVFFVLIVICLLLSLINKIRALDVKEPVYMQDGTEVDDDMMAAILVATIDYQKEIKEDVKVLGCKKIG